VQVTDGAARALCTQAPQRRASLRTTLYNDHAAGMATGARSSVEAALRPANEAAGRDSGRHGTQVRPNTLLAR
jgi:hypothetical protein